jgi:hypothetical protein
MMKHPLWRKLFGFVFVAVATFSIAADESSTPAPDVEIHGPNVRAGYPDAFALGYKLANDSISLAGKYGVIYADNPLLVEREVACNFLVALKPFCVLAVTEAYRYYDREALAVEWTKDSSAALVDVAGKWGSIGFTLFELHDGRVTRQTNLYKQMARLLEPGFRQAKVKPYNDIFHFILDSGGMNQEHETRIDADGQQIHVDVSATNNPKPIEPPMKTWGGRLQAVWSIPDARWITHKVTNSTYRQ